MTVTTRPSRSSALIGRVSAAAATSSKYSGGRIPEGVVGDEDVLFPPPEVKAAQRELPGSRFVELPGAGHSAYFETPAAFNDAVIGWLAQTGVALK